jgi:hypothetical protein
MSDVHNNNYLRTIRTPISTVTLFDLTSHQQYNLSYWLPVGSK